MSDELTKTEVSCNQTISFFIFNQRKKSSIINHINRVHTPQQGMFQCFCTSNDECGTRRHGMTGDEVRSLINDSFHVFQHYMKMQASEGGNENMIEESIDVLKCYMLKKINE